MTEPEDPRRDAGRELRRRAQGVKSDVLQSRLETFDEEVAEWADAFVFGRVWSRDGLAFEERMLVAITAVAVGGATDMLRNYLHGALQNDIPREKIREALVMTCVYAGFPAAISSLGIWTDVQGAHDRAAARED